MILLRGENKKNLSFLTGSITQKSNVQGKTIKTMKKTKTNFSIYLNNTV